MDGIEKRPAVKALIEKGKAAGKLTTQEIDTVIVDMDLDIEDLDKLYESIEAQNIEIIDDLSMLDVDDVNFWARRPSRPLTPQGSLMTRTSLSTTPSRSISRR